MTTEDAFKGRLNEVGATVVNWTGWQGSHAKYQAICAAGHECWPRPEHLQQGGGPCRVCAGTDPVAAEATARARLESLGHTPAWKVWIGAGRPHEVVCSAGHEFLLYPSALVRRRCICPHCAGTTTEAIENAFRDAVVSQGGSPAWEGWLGSAKGHKTICKNGHECLPTPNAVSQGGGICRFCKGKSWDVYYIVINDDKRELKFGITSGNPRHRLTVHRGRGYTRQVLVVKSPLALKVETETKRTLRTKGVQPAKGREYFPIEALGTVLEVAISFGLEDTISPEG